MPRPQRSTPTRERIGPYAPPPSQSTSPPSLPSPSRQTHIDHWSPTTRHHSGAHPASVPQSIRPLLNPYPGPHPYPHPHPHMPRFDQGGASGSGSGTGTGNSDGYPSPYPPPGSSYPGGPSLYGLGTTSYNVPSAFGPQGTVSPYGVFPPNPNFQSQVADGSPPPSASHSRRTSDMSPRRASSSKIPQIGDEGQEEDGDGAGKRRRVQRACDVCRRKKVRCDGPQPGRGACTNCITYSQVCKFEEATKRRAPPRSYTEALETRMEKVEQLLAELAPGVDFSDRIGLPVKLPDDPPKDPNKSGSPTRVHFVKPPPVPEPSEPARSVLPLDIVERDSMIARLGGKLVIKSEDSDDDERERDDDGSSIDSYSVTEEVAYVSSRALDMGHKATVPERDSRRGSTGDGRAEGSALSEEQRGQAASFIGNSSGFHMIPKLERMSKVTDVSEQLSAKVVYRVPQFPGMRPTFWAIPSCLTISLWDEEEAKELEMIRHAWPVPDLEAKLVDAFFQRPHNDYPVLYEPQFRADLKNPAKRNDREWVVLAMSVFAVASLYCDDDRVLETGYKDDFLPNTRGARWYNTCRRIGFRLAGPSPSLCHMQFMLLIVVYLLGTHLAQSVAWSFLGTIFRMLQFAGAHRKITAVRLQYPLHIEEAWRRNWWAAYSLDREMATMFGRPVAIQDEDFDVDPPLALDDHILLQGKSPDGKLPEQPAGVPPRLAGFACRIKLDEIIGKTLRTIYAIGKAKASRGIAGKGWDQLIVADLDSMLNQWLDTVPAHLRYDPDEPNEEFLVQSTLLHGRYYYAQILIHRPFIVGAKIHSSLNFPSLAIVTNAARLASQMLHNLLKRGVIDTAGLITTSLTFEVGCVLQLVRWGSKRSGLRTSSGAVQDVHKCLEVLGHLESRWPLAGKLNDLLQMLLSASDTGDDGEITRAQGKRKGRDDQGTTSMATDSPKEDSTKDARVIVGLARGKQPLSASAGNQKKGAQGQFVFTLPLSTQELGITPSTSTPERSSETDSPTGGASHSGPISYSRAQNANPSHTQAAPISSSGASQWLGDQQNQPLPSPQAMGPQSHDWRQQRFIESLAELNPNQSVADTDGLSIFNSTFQSPLDLPTFSSVLFTQGGGGGTGVGPGAGSSHSLTPSFGGPGVGGGGASTLTPGLSSFFDSTGLTPYLEYGSGGAVGTGLYQQQQQQQQQPSGSTSEQVDHHHQQQQHHLQSMEGSGGGGGGAGGMGADSDPFGHVFRDLWAAQDFFTEASAGRGGPNLQF